jgi:hypothetical protein
MPQIAIETELDCQRAIERIAGLGGCLEGTAEERELIELSVAVEVWEAKRWPHL